MTIVFLLKNGVEIKTKCEKFTLNRTGYYNIPTGYEIEGIIENKPMYIDWNEVAAVYRVMSDEIKDEKYKMFDNKELTMIMSLVIRESVNLQKEINELDSDWERDLLEKDLATVNVIGSKISKVLNK